MSSDAPETAPWRPGVDSLCENCGYRLQGLSAAAGCPECGMAVADSAPHHRVGLPWQDELSVSAFVRTAMFVAFRPRWAFRRLRVGGATWRAALFVWIIALALGVGWWGAWTVFDIRFPGCTAEMLGVSIVPAVVVMTFIEAAGVAYFSRRRGWRVPFAHARQVACYASVGWVPAVLLFDAFLRFQLGPAVTIASNPPDSGSLATLLFEFSTLITRYELIDEAVAAGIAMLGFELLVWVGVNQVRYANRPG